MIDLERIKDEKIKNIIFVVDGGYGKVIASTAVVERLAETYPDKKIIVVTGYPDVFQYNPHVSKCFNFNNTLYFYDDYVNKESYVIKAEPYVQYEYMMEHDHMIDVWCRDIGIERQGAMPKMYFLDNEIEAARYFVDKITSKGKKKFVMLQWIGGVVPQEKSDLATRDALNRMHRRSLPRSVAQKLVNKLITRGYAVGVVQHDNFPEIKGAEKLFFQPLRSVAALLKYSDGFIGIDSLLQHAGRALDVQGVVCWGGTSPKKLGYAMHKNIERQECSNPFCHRPDTYLFDASPNAGIWNCPDNTACMKYDADEILEVYETLKGKREKACQSQQLQEQ